MSNSFWKNSCFSAIPTWFLYTGSLFIVFVSFAAPFTLMFDSRIRHQYSLRPTVCKILGKFPDPCENDKKLYQGKLNVTFVDFFSTGLIKYAVASFLTSCDALENVIKSLEKFKVLIFVFSTIGMCIIPIIICVKANSKVPDEKNLRFEILTQQQTEFLFEKDPNKWSTLYED